MVNVDNIVAISSDTSPDTSPDTPVDVVEWRRLEGLQDYSRCLQQMEMRVADIIAGRAAEAVWLLEHPPLYTAGTSARRGDLLTPDRFPVYPAGRGGQYTYHGPGQRVVYIMLDLRRRGKDVRALIRSFERWIIASLAGVGVAGCRRPDQIGVFVARKELRETRASFGQSGDIAVNGEAAYHVVTDSGDETPEADGLTAGMATDQLALDKIAAIGVRLRRWVSFHGISVNVAPELEHFSGIVPCGIHDSGVTSLKALGIEVSMDQFDQLLRQEFERYFGCTTR